MPHEVINKLMDVWMEKDYLDFKRQWQPTIGTVPLHSSAQGINDFDF